MLPTSLSSIPSGCGRCDRTVVEDDPDIRGLVLVLAGRAGIGGLEAADGREGIRAFLDHRPDLVALDIGLPGLDGWQVLARIRELSEALVLVLTAAGEKRRSWRGLDEGADDYVTKPFDPTSLSPDPALLRCCARTRRCSTSSPTG